MATTINKGKDFFVQNVSVGTGQTAVTVPVQLLKKINVSSILIQCRTASTLTLTRNRGDGNALVIPASTVFSLDIDALTSPVFYLSAPSSVVAEVLFTTSGYRDASSLLSGLVSYYKFDENSGSVVGDSAGVNTGTWNGTLGSQWNTGIINSGGQFNGTDNYVDIPSLNNVINYSAISISFWFKYDTSLGNARVIANAHTDIDNKGFQIRFGGSTIFDIGSGSANGTVTNPAAISTDWHNVVATWDGSTMKLYFDGGTPSTAPFVASSIALSANNVNIGRNPVYAGDYYHGLIDEVGIWNRALLASEVNILYDAGIGKQYPFN